MESTRGSLQQNLNEFLKQYRRALHSTTGQPPAQLFLGHNIHIRLNLVRPDSTQKRITEKQQAEFNPTFRTFRPKLQVYFLSGNPRMDKWVAGTITKRIRDLHYEIDYLGKTFRRYVDQIRAFQYEETPDRRAEPIQPPVSNTKRPDPRRRTHFYGVEPVPPLPIAPRAPIEPRQRPADPGSAQASHAFQQSSLANPPREFSAPHNRTPPQLPRRSTRIPKPRQLFSPT